MKGVFHLCDGLVHNININPRVKYLASCSMLSKINNECK